MDVFEFPINLFSHRSASYSINTIANGKIAKVVKDIPDSKDIIYSSILPYEDRLLVEMVSGNVRITKIYDKEMKTAYIIDERQYNRNFITVYLIIKNILYCCYCSKRSIVLYKCDIVDNTVEEYIYDIPKKKNNTWKKKYLKPHLHYENNVLYIFLRRRIYRVDPDMIVIEQEDIKIRKEDTGWIFIHKNTIVSQKSELEDNNIDNNSKYKSLSNDKVLLITTIEPGNLIIRDLYLWDMKCNKLLYVDTIHKEVHKGHPGPIGPRGGYSQEYQEQFIILSKTKFFINTTGNLYNYYELKDNSLINKIKDIQIDDYPFIIDKREIPAAMKDSISIIKNYINLNIVNIILAFV